MTALDTYVRSYADTLRIVREHAAEMDRAARSRAQGYEDSAKRRETGAAELMKAHTKWLYKQHGPRVEREWVERAKVEATAPPVCEAPAPKPAPRARAARVKGETRAERSARNKAAWAAGNRGEAAK